SITRTVLTTQLYITVAALSTLLLAAVASERETLAREVRRSRTRLVEAADAERRRIERDLHDGAQQRLTALTNKLHLISDRTDEVPAEVTAGLGEAEAGLELAIDGLGELAPGARPAGLAGPA